MGCAKLLGLVTGAGAGKIQGLVASMHGSEDLLWVGSSSLYMSHGGGHGCAYGSGG